MKETGLLICNAEKVRRNGQMGPFTKDATKMDLNMEKVIIFGQINPRI